MLIPKAVSTEVCENQYFQKSEYKHNRNILLLNLIFLLFEQILHALKITECRHNRNEIMFSSH